jgi:hypothetical protein
MQSTDAPLSWGLAEAIKANDGTVEVIDWMEVELQEVDLIVTVPRLPLRMQINGQLMAVSVSYAEQVLICRLLDCVSPTHDWFQALWRAATVKLTPCPLVRTATDAQRMGDLDFLTRENADFERQLTNHAVELGGSAFARGFAKAWLIGRLMGEQGVHGAENEGFEYPDGHELQGEGGAHNDKHLDYSQWCWDICKRKARRLSTGEEIDLLDIQMAAFPQFAAQLAMYNNTSAAA